MGDVEYVFITNFSTNTEPLAAHHFVLVVNETNLPPDRLVYVTNGTNKAHHRQVYVTNGTTRIAYEKVLIVNFAHVQKMMRSPTSR